MFNFWNPTWSQFWGIWSQSLSQLNEQFFTLISPKATPCSLTHADISKYACSRGNPFATKQFLGGIMLSGPKSALCHGPFIIVQWIFVKNPNNQDSKVKEFEMLNHYKLIYKFSDWLREIIRLSHDLKTIVNWWLIGIVPLVWHRRLLALPRITSSCFSENVTVC